MASVPAPGAVRRVLTFWRRSIQARVVASTVLLSLLVVGGVGWFLLTQTREGLLDKRVRSVVVQATAETEVARQALATAPGTDVDVAGQRVALIEPLKERGSAGGFQVVLAGPIRTSSTLIRDGVVLNSAGLDIDSVPVRLQQHFAEAATTSNDTHTAWTYATITTTSQSGRTTSEPGVVVGAPVRLPADDKFYTVYYLYPLTEQAETLGLITRGLATAAALLVVFVAGLTWLVARQVVTPIRMARRVAERLAAGELRERLVVSGEDDLARLATSFNQMASNLQRQIRQLEELSRVQRRFVSDVSHELRTPLTTVRMASDVLHDARDRFDPATSRAAELLQTELDRFETLLSDLLEISRFDAGAAVLELDDVNLVDVVHRVVSSTQVLADRRGTRLVVREPDHPCLAEADVRRIERILRNLVTNAIDHGESRDVVVSVGSDDEAAAVTVRDHGIGLGPGESAMVFNRFWRADPARARTTGGTGLGLAIALEDAHLHGGWLQAWGQFGRGSQFRLTLPRHSGQTLRRSPLLLVPEDAEELV